MCYLCTVIKRLMTKTKNNMIKIVEALIAELQMIKVQIRNRRLLLTFPSSEKAKVIINKELYKLYEKKGRLENSLNVLRNESRNN